MPTKLEDLRAKLGAKAEQLQKVFDEAGPDMDFERVAYLSGDVSSKLAQVRSMNAELEDLHRQVKDIEDLEDIAGNARQQWSASREPSNPMQHPSGGAGRGHEAEARSIGRLFIESNEYQQYQSQRNWPVPAAFPQYDIRNAVFRTGAGWDPEDLRISRVELDPQRPIAVIDNIPMLPTTQSSIVFMEETTFTNNAQETAESTATTASDLIGEAALALTERTKPVEWLPVFIPVTMQQMEDVEGIQAYVDSRLRYMIRARLDLQVLAGNGSTPNLEGTENVTGIQAQAKGSDTEEDAIFKLFTSIRDAGFAEPSVAFIRPDKFQNIRLRKTADGQYIWGHPSMPGPFTIWGVTLVQTTAVTATKCIAGDYANFSALYTKRGITLAVSDSHAHYFTRGMLAIRADTRVAMVHFRPEAFGEVTGL